MPFTLRIGAPVPTEELLKKPTAGRQPSERDLALIELVNKVAEPDNSDLSFPWNYEGEKPITARAAAVRAIRRAGQENKVFVGSKDGMLWFSQQPLSNRGRKKK